MLIVQKYGGTSVGDLERIQNVARRVRRVRDAGHQVVVVVSAMSGETDSLVAMANALSPLPPEREMDMLLSTGERKTIALLAIALTAMGTPSQAFTGRQVGIETDSAHTRARIERISGERLRKSLAEGYVPVVAGFQGINAQSDVTTLGRGGSDLTAVAVAAAIQADRCDIYTDVDGVYTADPRIVSNARKLDRIAFEEMLELASLGAKVLQTRSVLFAMRHGVPVQVLSSFTDQPGTLVTKEDAEMEQLSVSGVTYDRNQAKVTITDVPDQPGVASRLFKAISDANIMIDMIIQNVGHDGCTDISFTIPRTDVAKLRSHMGTIRLDGSPLTIDVDDRIAKVSAVGVGMRSHSGVATRMFDTLAQNGVNIKMISTSEIKISCVIDERYTELAVRALHDAFELGVVPGGTS
ncbi:MAG: aspartate kinase [Nitrospirae bacterium]|nr:aspartate kinase [Nitrospirota bacterium]